METTVNYVHVVEGSHFFGSIDMMIEWLKYTPFTPISEISGTLTKMLQETKRNGYELRKEEPKKEPEIAVLQPVQCVPYQICPKCNGQRVVAKPPWVDGQQMTWVSDNGSYPCDICNGSGIIPMKIIENI
jgi:hypothetical protein